jgi:hypothetical protein
MAKRCNSELLDLPLNAIKSGNGTVGPVTRQVACSAEPTTYTEANATYALADVTMASGDFTVGAGDGSGNTPRKCTVGAKTGVTVDTSGTATHVALLDVTNSKLIEVTTCTSQALTAGNTVNFPAWDIEFSAPT